MADYVYLCMTFNAIKCVTLPEPEPEPPLLRLPLIVKLTRPSQETDQTADKEEQLMWVVDEDWLPKRRLSGHCTKPLVILNLPLIYAFVAWPGPKLA